MRNETPPSLPSTQQFSLNVSALTVTIGKLPWLALVALLLIAGLTRKMR